MKSLFLLFLNVFMMFSLTNMFSEENTVTLDISFRKEITENGLYMVIYYHSPYYTFMTYTDDQIRNGWYDYKIEINTTMLARYPNELFQLQNAVFEQADEDEVAFDDALVSKRILCDFVDKRGDIILSFTYGQGRYVFLNDKIVRRHDSLRNIIKIYLPSSVDFDAQYRATQE